MANNVIYLPPGVAAPQPAPVPSHTAGPMPTGIPFDRAFFETILPQAVHAFCTQTHCETPRVELLTADGAKHFVSGISGVSDTWVALTVAEEEHSHSIQVFIPYQTIFRVEVHPEEDPKRHALGFSLQERPKVLEAAAPVEPPAAESEPITKKVATAARKALALAAHPLAGTGETPTIEAAPPPGRKATSAARKSAAAAAKTAGREKAAKP